MWPWRRTLVLAACLFTLGWSLPSGAIAPDNSVAWIVQGRPSALAQSAVQILEQAGDEGLNPSDYDATVLGHSVVAATKGKPLTAEQQTALNAAISQSLLRYLHDLHYGRVDPRSVYANFNVAPKTLNLPATLNAAVAAGDLKQAVKAATPAFPLYQALKPWLARYRALEHNPAWVGNLPALPAQKLEPGAPYAGVALLTARLVSLGDLPADFVAPDRYQGPLVDGVKIFQKRHGLTEDGVIGKTTFEQLNVKPAARVEQIALTMERLRWTPLMADKRVLVVNLPEFELRGLEIDGEAVQIPLKMNVIVGKALNTRTPMFDEQMRAIEFSPYWNVPPSITRAETVPKLRRDPGYFDRQGFEIVTRSGEVVTRFDETHLAALQNGQARIRQRPGAQNALGDIKFIFPNNDNIYMHHTPSVGLFQRDRRDFSHGCIRVEAPVELAQFVLKDEPEWTAEKIREAMENGTSKTIRLKTPVMVVIAYATAIVKQRGGTIYFYADIYGHDRQLRAALSQYSQRLQAQASHQSGNIL
ncbi:L,D-transpeptidase family protein [Fluviibacter phosphoraccumulans]|uniref:L,D-transpeptidase family protein n=1 Tax=Fluviibacter phosphoraccumulans TaxID=1751046 RepID=UPI0024E1B2D7|nr:L,D-transpeptidase family protein [Fluviibacter phosphoraccumulans]